MQAKRFRHWLERVSSFRSMVFLPPTLALVFASVAAVSSQQPAAAGAAAAFPLTTGTYWLYDGVARWSTPGAAEQSEKEVQWRMEVREVIPRGNFVGAVVRGYLADLNGSQGDTKPADSIIVQSGENKYYLVPSYDYEKVLGRLRDPHDSLADLVNENELILELPLEPLKKFCGPQGMARTDGFYCWVVNQASPAALSSVKGAPAGDRTAYQLQFITVPDATTIEFVPDVGITSYIYRNHETGGNTEMTLVEFHPGAH
jgi:hypothetical protein